MAGSSQRGTVSTARTALTAGALGSTVNSNATAHTMTPKTAARNASTPATGRGNSRSTVGSQNSKATHQSAVSAAVSQSKNVTPRSAGGQAGNRSVTPTARSTNNANAAGRSTSAGAMLKASSRIQGGYPTTTGDLKGSAAALSENRRYVTHAGFQQWRKPMPDKSTAATRQIEEALAEGDLRKLQEAYRAVCIKDHSSFLVQTNLVAKVVYKIQEVAKEKLDQAVRNRDFKALGELDQDIQEDPVLAPMMNTPEMEKASQFLALAHTVEAVQEIESRSDQREPPLPRQKQLLDELASAINRAQRVLSPEDLDEAIGKKEDLTIKVELLENLQRALAAKNVSAMESAIREANDCQDISEAELDFHMEKLDKFRLQDALRNEDEEAIADALDPAMKRPGNEDLVMEAKRFLVMSNLKAAMASGEMTKLRAAIEDVNRVKVYGEQAQMLIEAEKELENLEAALAKNSEIIERLKSATSSRDTAALRAVISEVDKAEFEHDAVHAAKTTLCEEEIRQAMGRADRAVLRVKLRLGRELSVDKELLETGTRFLEEGAPAGVETTAPSTAKRESNSKEAGWHRIKKAIQDGQVDQLQLAIEYGRDCGVEAVALEEATSILQRMQQAVAKKRAAEASRGEAFRQVAGQAQQSHRQQQQQQQQRAPQRQGTQGTLGSRR